MIKIHFSDFFEVDAKILARYGAFNISLLNDAEAFVDPFLLFGSNKREYQRLHVSIIEYVKFIITERASRRLDDVTFKYLCEFHEVKQNWLGFSRLGNQGRGLGKSFTDSLALNINRAFSIFNRGDYAPAHIEELCLFEDGVGRDNISDFTTNLIKEYLLNYTQAFAATYLRPEFVKPFSVDRVGFNYRTLRWESGVYRLPTHPVLEGDYVILTPRDIITRRELWINKDELYRDYFRIAKEDDQLRKAFNAYIRALIPPTRGRSEPTQTQYYNVANQVIPKFPRIVELYVKKREAQALRAAASSMTMIRELEDMFVERLEQFAKMLDNRGFYQQSDSSPEGILKRVDVIQDVIRKGGGYKLFYLGSKLISQDQLQILLRIAWYANQSSGASNRRPPIQFKIGNGHLIKSLEGTFKAGGKDSSAQPFIAILCFSAQERTNANMVLNALELNGQSNIKLINAFK